MEDVIFIFINYFLYLMINEKFVNIYKSPLWGDLEGLLFFLQARSSSGLGHRPLKAGITGSNPVRATNFKLQTSNYKSQINTKLYFPS